MGIVERKKWVFQKYSNHPFFFGVPPVKAKALSDLILEKSLDECRNVKQNEAGWEIICQNYVCRLNIANDVITALG